MLIIVVAAALWGLNVWAVMLILGGLHGSVWPSIPALGFWPSALVTLTLWVVGSFFKSSK